MMGHIGVITGIAVLLFSSSAFAAGNEAKAKVAYEEFIELRAGPGSGYPVYVVIEQGEEITLVSRRSSWYKVSSNNDADAAGWITVDDLYAAIYPAAEVPRRLGGYYDDRRLEASVGVGIFGGDSYYQSAFGYRLWSNLTARAAVAKSIGDYSSSTIYSAQLVTRLFTNSVLSPVVIADLGVMSNSPRKTLVSASSSSMSVVGFGFGVDWNIAHGLKWHSSVVSNTASSVTNGSKVFVAWQTGLTAIF